MKLSHLFPVLLIATGIFFGCSKSDKDNLIGIWRVKASLVDGRDVGDGLGWFEFKPDGKVDTRPRPGKYDSGNYTLDSEKHLLKLSSESGSLEYSYKLNGDELEMSALMGNDMKLLVQCVRVDDYPITKDKDAPDDAQFQPH